MLSRRQFFQSLTPSPSFHPLGRFQDFPVGLKKKIVIQNHFQIQIESLPEGLRALDIKTSQHLGLSIHSNGTITLHLKETWPENVVLSLITGEAYSLS